MTRLATLAAVAALLPAAAFAQSNTAAKTAPVTKPKAAQSSAPAAAKAMPAHMATAKTKSGKTITYDCSKKGNMTKKACKG